jgi:hypothetical protein
MQLMDFESIRKIDEFPQKLWNPKAFGVSMRSVGAR